MFPYGVSTKNCTNDVGDGRVAAANEGGGGDDEASRILATLLLGVVVVILSTFGGIMVTEPSSSLCLGGEWMTRGRQNVSMGQTRLVATRNEPND